MRLYFEAGLIFACLGLGAWVGWKAHGGVPPTVMVQESIHTVIQESKATERVVFKDRIVTVTEERRPDGSVTTSTTTEDKSSTKEKAKVTTKVEQDTSRLATGTTSPHSYSLTLALPVLKDLDPYRPSWKDITWGAGAKVIGGFWFESGYQWSRKELSLGVRYEW